MTLFKTLFISCLISIYFPFSAYANITKENNISMTDAQIAQEVKKSYPNMTLHSIPSYQVNTQNSDKNVKMHILPLDSRKINSINMKIVPLNGKKISNHKEDFIPSTPLDINGKNVKK